MKLVILAAGKGTRMGESSLHTPKPILEYKDKNLIQHKLEQLPSAIHEVIIVIGHLGERIRQKIGNNFTNKAGISIPIAYIVQDELLGTAHSLWQAKDKLLAGGEPFLVLMGDDLYSKEDMNSMIVLFNQRPNSWITLVQKVDQQMTAGKCIVDEKGRMVDIVEDPEGKIKENIMYTGGCLLTPQVFELEMVPIGSKGEYGLPQTFMQMAQNKDILAVEATYWKRVTAPEDLAD